MTFIIESKGNLHQLNFGFACPSCKSQWIQRLNKNTIWICTKCKFRWGQVQLDLFEDKIEDDFLR